MLPRKWLVLPNNQQNDPNHPKKRVFRRAFPRRFKPFFYVRRTIRARASKCMSSIVCVIGNFSLPRIASITAILRSSLLSSSLVPSNHRA